VIAAAVASLLLVLVGWPVAAALDRRSTPIHRRVAESYLLGAALASLILFALSLAHVRWSRASLLLPLIAIAVACAWIGRRAMAVTRPDKPSAANLIDVLTAVMVAGYARFATIGPTAEYDFIGIWGVKAREFWVAGGIDWQFLENPFNQFAHADYPLLVPLVFDVHAVVACEWPDRWLGVVNAGFGIATLLLLRAFLAEEVRTPLLRAVATLALVGVAFAPWIGLAEGPLVAYGTAGLLFIRRGLLSERGGEAGAFKAAPTVPHSDIMRGGLYLGLAAMCKNEGLTLIVAAAAGVAVAAGVRKIVRLWPALAMVIPWLVIRSMHHLETDLTASGLGERAVQHLTNLGPMFDAMLRYPAGRPILWLAIASALIIGARQVAGRERFLASAIAMQLLFFVAAYAITPHDVEWHVRWSWERIVDQLAAAATFLALVLVIPRPEEEAKPAEA